MRVAVTLGQKKGLSFSLSLSTLSVNNRYVPLVHSRAFVSRELCVARGGGQAGGRGEAGSDKVASPVSRCDVGGARGFCESGEGGEPWRP